MARNAENGVERLWNLFRIVAWSGAVLVMIAPAVVMRFPNSGVNWTASDFVFAGVMIGGAGLIFELTLWLSKSNAYRSGVCLMVAAIFLLIWINGAVGIIGSENNELNQMYVGVIAVAVFGSFFARFKARGMAWAMTTAAAGHAVITCVAIANGYFTMLIDGFFAVMWLLAAHLFREHAQARAAATAS